MMPTKRPARLRANLLAVLPWLCFACAKSGAAPDVDRLVRVGQDQALRAVVPAATAAQLTQLVIFGDSLSDTGRLKSKTFGWYFPGTVYWHGRASDGPVWADYIAAAVPCAVANYAVAGAATGDAGFPVNLVLPSLADEVDEYVAAAATSPRTGPIVAVIWIGPNNYLGDEPKSVNTTIADIRQGAVTLLQHGVSRLALGTMPNLAGVLRSAAAVAKRPDQELEDLTLQHNRAMAALVDELGRRFPKQAIILFNAFAINQATVERPQAYAFTTLKEACYHGDYRGNFAGEASFCRDSIGHKLWDNLHPNSLMHCYYAARFLADVQKAGWLPEAETGNAAIRACQRACIGR